MKNIRDIGETTRSYRRGTVMGLTVAEIFILLVFALLLLLFLIREEFTNNSKALENELEDKTKSLQEALSKNQKVNEQINLLQQAQAKNKSLESEITKKNDLLQDSLSRNEELGQDNKKLQDAVQAMEESLSDPNLAKIIEHSKKLQPDERRLLTEFMTKNNLPKRLTKSLQLEEFISDSTNEKLTNQIMDLDQLEKKQLSEWMTSSQEFKDVLSRREELTEILSEVDKEISKQVGSLVEDFGGKMEPNGVLYFPNKQNFTSGSSSLTPKFKGFLDDFCPRYIESLSQFPDDIQDIRVGGHSSSEWGASSSTEEGYLKNLDLSQQRAYAVLSYCLDVLKGNPDLFNWAREKITAVGYSSSRPILDENNEEDKEESRRVSFSVIFNNDQPINGL